MYTIENFTHKRNHDIRVRKNRISRHTASDNLPIYAQLGNIFFHNPRIGSSLLPNIFPFSFNLIGANKVIIFSTTNTTAAISRSKVTLICGFTKTERNLILMFEAIGRRRFLTRLRRLRGISAAASAEPFFRRRRWLGSLAQCSNFSIGCGMSFHIYQ